MLIFNFPTMTAEPIELNLSDFVPAPNHSTDGEPAFMFGTAIVSLFPRKDVIHPVCLFSHYDKKKKDWRNIQHGTCTAETCKALREYYYNNI